MSAIGVVEATVQQIVLQEDRMEGVLGGCYQLIHRVHRIWRWYRRAELYSDPNNLLCLAAGQGLNWLGGGDNAVINVAAHVLLVATRIIACVEAQIHVVREVRSLWDDATNPYFLPPKVKWEIPTGKKRWISFSTHMRWREISSRLIDRIKRVALRLLSLAKALFLLSMKTLDAAEAFSSNNNCNERINELFLNSRKCLKVLVDYQELLLHGLEKYRGIIERLLGNTHSLLDADQFIAVVTQSFKAASFVNGQVDTASTVIGELGVDFTKRMAFGLFQAAGLLELMPHGWVPGKNPFQEKEEERESCVPRFLPIEDTRYPDTYAQFIQNEVNIEMRKIPVPRRGQTDTKYRQMRRGIERKLKNRYAELYKMPLT